MLQNMLCECDRRRRGEVFHPRHPRAPVNSMDWKVQSFDGICCVRILLSADAELGVPFLLGLATGGAHVDVPDPDNQTSFTVYSAQVKDGGR